MDKSAGREYVGASEDAVAASELKSLKPGRTVYERGAPNLFILSNREKALAHVEARLSEARAAEEAAKKERAPRS